MKATGVKAGQAVNDSARFKPNTMKNIEMFEFLATEHFRKNGHRWARSMIHKTSLIGLREMQSQQAFENWILSTAKQHDRSTFEVIEVS